MAAKSKNPFAPDLLEDQVALITGGGSGIGLAIAHQLGAMGARVAIASRKQERLDQAQAELEAAGIKTMTQTCDIREGEQVDALVDAVLEREGKLDILVNNAGGQFPSPAEGLSRKGFDAVIRNNLNGTFYVTHAAATKHMIPQEGGVIVNIIADIYRGFPGMLHTGAARAGVDNMTKTLAIEWCSYGIRVNSVAPGIIYSSGMDNYPPELVEAVIQRIPTRRFGTVEEVAHAVAFLASPAASYISGETLYVDGASRLWGETWPIAEK